MWKHIASEYIGTLLLILLISLIGNPVAVAAAFLVIVMLVGKYSSGYFNPAVTLWAFLKGKITSNLAIGQVLAQLAAALTVWKLV